MQRSGPLHPGPVCQQQHISKWFPFNSLQKETFHVAFVTHSAAIIYSNTPKKMTTSMQSNTGLGQVMIGVLHSLVTRFKFGSPGISLDTTKSWLQWWKQTPPLIEERQLFLFHFCWELLSYYFAEIDMCILITVNHLIFFFFNNIDKTNRFQHIFNHNFRWWNKIRFNLISPSKNKSYQPDLVVLYWFWQ